MKKRLIAGLLCLCMLFSLIPAFTLSASAVTFSQVVSWMDSKKGKTLDYDGQFGGQCVDLFNYYLRDVWGISNPISAYPVGSAYQIFNYNAPSGWQKISGAGNYRVGDVVIWNQSASSSNGHVGIVYSVNGSSVTICQQNYNKMQYVTMQPIHSTGTIRGVFRPPLQNDPAPQPTTVKASKIVSWIDSKLGKALDFDGNYGAQGPDLFNYYMKELWGVSNPISAYPISSSYQYFDYNVPSGWQKITGAGNYRVGDIVIWNKVDGYSNGYIGIVYSVNGNSVTVCYQNYNGKQYVALDTLQNTGSIRGVFRPPVDMDLPDPPPFRFDDVKNEKAFYFDAVYWAYEANPQITNGIDANHFAPNQSCTRGQVVTFLWRAAKCPEPKTSTTKFTDVKSTAFYAKAVAWAVENGITKGISNTRFSPNSTCTRAQIVTFLWRYKNSPAPKSLKTGFTDVDTTAYYIMAVAWAVENNITSGITKTSFAPNDVCTRGQVVTFLYRTVTGK